MSSTKPSNSSSSRRRSPPTTTTTTTSTSGTKPPPSSSPSSKKATSTSKRLIQELAQLRAQERDSVSTTTTTTTELSPIERLGPVSDDELFHWEAVVNGKGLGGGYDAGRWLLDIRVPDGNGSAGGSAGGSYPNAPPVVRFVTRICAANVGFETGEICLDLLKTAWTPAYTLKMTVEAIWQMLAAPGIDSPLNVDIAALIRQGDRVGSEALVRWGCGEWRWDRK